MKLLDSELDRKMDPKNPRQRLRAFCKFIRALSPIPYITRARDCYVRSMIQCAGRGNYAEIVAGPGTVAAPVSSLAPNSFLWDRDDDDRELVKAACERQRATPRPRKTKLSDHEPFPRTVSTRTDHSHIDKQLGVGRIDEESLVISLTLSGKVVVICHSSVSVETTDTDKSNKAV